MPIAILETGAPPKSLQAPFGRYPAMFAQLLGSSLVEAVYDVRKGEYPTSVDQHAALLITGSPASAYDDQPWIHALRDWLVAAKGRTRLIGICFGHQIMAEAFGGKVAKSAKGWGIGLHRYDVAAREHWMGGSDGIALPASHQDQVVVHPPRTRILAGNEFCPIGMLAYDDQPAVSMQLHPEFEPGFAAALIGAMRDQIPDPTGALAWLDQPNDRSRVAEWIRAFVGVGAAPA